MQYVNPDKIHRSVYRQGIPNVRGENFSIFPSMHCPHHIPTGRTSVNFLLRHSAFVNRETVLSRRSQREVIEGSSQIKLSPQNSDQPTSRTLPTSTSLFLQLQGSNLGDKFTRKTAVVLYSERDPALCESGSLFRISMVGIATKVCAKQALGI